MLKKRKEKEAEKRQTAVPERTFTKSEPAPAPKTMTSSDRTVIGQQIAIEGSIRGKESLLIEGSLKGKIMLEEHQVIVGPKGRVEAEIHAKDVTIGGKMAGNINALGKVKITKTAEFHGEVKAKGISVEDGAYIKAVIELEREEKQKVPYVGNPDLKVASSGSTPKPVAAAAGADKGK